MFSSVSVTIVARAELNHWRRVETQVFKLAGIVEITFGNDGHKTEDL